MAVSVLLRSQIIIIIFIFLCYVNHGPSLVSVCIPHDYLRTRDQPF